MPSKPIKRGYKVWCLADSSTRYLYNFDIYCGKEDDREGTLAENVVLRLISKINLVEHRLFFDNFFTTISLLIQLKKKKIGATGIIRTNRKLFPKELLRKEQLQRGFVIEIYQKEEVDPFIYPSKSEIKFNERW
jgi:hypothetical protein